jgi:hypothetical protein
MDLSFNISGAGPLSQISAHIISFDIAVWLASGAVGWWKARERSLSLIEYLSARKTSLVSTSTFNYNMYREARKLGTIQALAVQRGIIQRFGTGVESTAVTENPGIDCLRALTTGLLCFYSVQLTSTILADIVPYALLQSDQEDDNFEFTGPLFASLSDWVKAVAAEEDCNNFRQHLLQSASTLCRNLTDTHAAQDSDDSAFDELGLLLGCLRWMVTPQHRRGLLKYPSRSIRVWTTMAIMSKLGFSVEVYLATVQTEEQYDAILNPPYEDDFPDVVLVTSAHGKTDPWCVTVDTYQQLDLRPQIMPILSIPNAIFGRLQRKYDLVDAAALIDIWKVCYRHAKLCINAPTLSSGGKVHIKPRSDEYAVYRDSHKALLALWTPHLARIMRPACEDYLPKTLDGNWSPDAIKAFIHRQSDGERVYLEDVEVMRNVYIITAMLLGTIYGVCSTVLSTHTLENKDCQSGDDGLEVALSPDIIQSNKVHVWARALGSALCGVLEQSGWVSFLLELVTGIEHTEPLDEESSLGAAGKRLNISTQRVYDASQVRISDVFGAQANGVFALSEFILRPSTNAARSLIFHVGSGRILDIPLDQNGYVRASQWKQSAAELILNPEPELDHLSLQPNLGDYPNLRFDAEPHWQIDPRTICFSVRSAGKLTATLDIRRLLEKLLSSTVECKCGQTLDDVSVSPRERWQDVTVHQLLRSGMPGASKSSTFIKDNDRIVVNVGGDDMCRAYAAAIISCRKIAICSNCVFCAHKKIKDRNSNMGPGSAAIIIG